MSETDNLRIRLQTAVQKGLRESSAEDAMTCLQNLEVQEESLPVFLEHVASEFNTVETGVLEVLVLASDVLRSTAGVVARVDGLGLICEIPAGHRHELRLRRQGLLVYADTTMDNGLCVQSMLLGSLVPSQPLVRTHDLGTDSSHSVEFVSGAGSVIRAFLSYLEAFVLDIGRVSRKAKAKKEWDDLWGA